jgi:hypothetical protein
MAAEANFILQRQHATVILARQAAMREVRRRRQKLGLRETLPHSTSLGLARSGLPLILSRWSKLHAVTAWTAPSFFK